jgi:hypothetical protein
MKTSSTTNDKEQQDVITQEGTKPSSLPVNNNTKRKNGGSRLGVIGSLVRMRSQRHIHEEESKAESDNDDNTSTYKITSASNTAIDSSDKSTMDDQVAHHTSYDQHSISTAIDQPPLNWSENEDGDDEDGEDDIGTSTTRSKSNQASLKERNKTRRQDRLTQKSHRNDIEPSATAVDSYGEEEEEEEINDSIPANIDLSAFPY